MVAKPKPGPSANYDLALSLNADRKGVNTEADTLSYDLVITNIGPRTAFGITLTDTLPQFISAFKFSEAARPDSRECITMADRFSGSR